jgi:hypothetical protein
LADRRTYVLCGIGNAAGGMHRSFASLRMTSAVPMTTTFKQPQTNLAAHLQTGRRRDAAELRYARTY